MKVKTFAVFCNVNSYVLCYLTGDPVPVKATPLYMPGATFDKNYNSHFKPINFTVPKTITKVGDFLFKRQRFRGNVLFVIHNYLNIN